MQIADSTLLAHDPQRWATYGEIRIESKRIEQPFVGFDGYPPPSFKDLRLDTSKKCIGGYLQNLRKSLVAVHTVQGGDCFNFFQPSDEALA